MCGGVERGSKTKFHKAQQPKDIMDQSTPTSFFLPLGQAGEETVCDLFRVRSLVWFVTVVLGEWVDGWSRIWRC